MTEPALPIVIGGKKRITTETLRVLDKWDGTEVGSVCLASRRDIDDAIRAARDARLAVRRTSLHERQAVLRHVIKRATERRAEWSMLLAREAGKPIRDSRGEIDRFIETFERAVEECARAPGEMVPMDLAARAKGMHGFVRRVPVGVCALITPFNFPFNLVAHKVAPAIVAGCPFVLKPASTTPLSALALADVLLETHLPPGAFSVVPTSREQADYLAIHPEVAFLSFTGSADVGWDLAARAGRKRVSLELGGNAAVVVCEDADLDDACQRIVNGAYYQSGQSCVSVQRVLVHSAVYDQVRDLLSAKVRTLVPGDPKDEATAIGPLIGERDAIRVEKWVTDAVNSGASLLVGGNRARSLYPATLIEDVPRGANLRDKEVFGPVAVLIRFETWEEAVAEVNATEFGLQAGVFTRDVERIFSAWDELEVGGVLVNEVPTFRVDHMPYGGVKASGRGREGIRYAVEEMCEPRLLAIRTRA